MIKIMKLGETKEEEIFFRKPPETDVSKAVSDILRNVRENGDKAILEYVEKFDGAKLDSLLVSEEEIEEAFKSEDEKFIEVLKSAAKNIEEFHKKQLQSGYEIKGEKGIVLGQKVIPVEKAGIYVPGGQAPLSSTVLMDTIPAKIAGVKEIVMVTPPMKNGKVNSAILAAAKIAGADRIYKVGGAQAIAALAYGTESIPKVDKIVGPGSAFVAEAKKQVFGIVSIDMIAGPSEILVIADKSAVPSHVAADMLSQAEHDRMASAVLVTDSEELASSVSLEIERQLKLLPRYEVARVSIDNHGKIIIAENIDEVIDIANRIAPEHLELSVDNPFDYLERIRNAGSIFLGKYAPEALGDYYAGSNHTLPTGGTAKFSSPLSVDDFVHKSQYIYYTKEALLDVAEDIALFAEKEELSAHARSVTIRMEDK
ncbi:MAG: histidinol dehydrogenase [Clostridia bacterium]|nr:histidinol dehydrogenase [Clostridia bacterium]